MSTAAAAAADFGDTSLFTASKDSQAIMPGSEFFGEIEAFLYFEAELMDSHAYDSWHALWEPGGLYWVPCNHADLDPNQSVSIIYEHTDQLGDRIFRLKDKRMHSQSPKSRLIRIISNISVTTSGASDILVFSNFILGEARAGQQQSLFGRATHRLKQGPDGFKIAGKKVYLINNDAPMRNVTFLL